MGKLQKKNFIKYASARVRDKIERHFAVKKKKN